MEIRTETPTLYITGQGRKGIETARKLSDIVTRVEPSAGGLALYQDSTNVASAFKQKLEGSGSRAQAVMVHSISYDRDNAQAIIDAISAAKEQFPEVFHLGLVLKPVDPLSSIYFRQTEQHPLEGLGIPLIVLDEGRVIKIRQRRPAKTQLNPEDMVFYGLIGFYKGHSIFPELNPHTPREMLEALTDNGHLIGVAVGEEKNYLFQGTFPHTNIPIPFSPRFLMKDEVNLGIDSAITDAISETGDITPFKRQADSNVNVLAVQIPFKFEHPYWKNRQSLKRFRDVAVLMGEHYNVKADSLVFVFSPVVPPIRDEAWVSTTATHFYPVSA